MPIQLLRRAAEASDSDSPVAATPSVPAAKAAPVKSKWDGEDEDDNNVAVRLQQSFFHS